MTINSNQIICALDFDDFSKAENFIKAMDYDIVYKVGMEFFYRFGIDGIRKISNAKNNIKLFLDLKLHDIPNTVERAIYPLVTNVRPLHVNFTCSRWKKMLQNAVFAATEASKNSNIQKPLLLGVTVLTSLNNQDLKEMGHTISITQSVENYSNIAKKAKFRWYCMLSFRSKTSKKYAWKKFKSSYSRYKNRKKALMMINQGFYHLKKLLIWDLII